MQVPNMQARSQVADLIALVDSLQLSDADHSGFFGDLLRLMLSAVEATDGVIWQQSRSGQVEPMVAIEHGQGELLASISQPKKADLLSSVFMTTEPTLTVGKVELDKQPIRPPTGALVPIRDSMRTLAVVEIDLSQRSPEESEFAMTVLCLIAERVGWQYVLNTASMTHHDLKRMIRADVVKDNVGSFVEMREMSYNLVNRLQQYLGCDRVSLAIYRGTRTQLKAISNQALFDRRSGVVRRIERLTREVARLEQPLWQPDERSDLPPQLRDHCQRYFDVAGTNSIGLVPVMAEPKRRDDPEDIAATIRSTEQRKQCIAVLVLEGIEAPLNRKRLQRRWERVELSVSHAISNSRKYDGFFLMPVWRTLGIAADWYRGHTRRKACLITAAVLAILLSLVLVPADFKLRGVGEIQPLERAHVYAQTDGTVRALNVVDGQDVAQGELLMQLENPKLLAEVAEVAGKLEEAQSELRTVTAIRAGRSYESEQEMRELIRKSATVEARIEGLSTQLALLRKKQQLLRIASPMGGRVVTWDVSQRLQGRPVKPGEKLVTVASAEGPWEIELRIPDKRTGYLLRRWTQSKQADESLPVSFVLASAPLDVRWGTVIDIAPASNVDEKESENVLRIRVRMTKQEFAKLGDVRPGTSVIGHVHCGRSSIGYCKLYEFFDWTKRMWFKFVS